MELVDKLRKQIENIALPAMGPKPLEAEDDQGRHFCCELAALDTLGCAFTRFELTNDNLAHAPIEQLKTVAEKLASRLTYLLEPIAPLEVDSERCVVQMRSNPPQQHEQQTSYYELLVRRGGHLSLCRYVKDPTNVRQVVPTQVTREVFWRLVGDFAQA